MALDEDLLRDLDSDSEEEEEEDEEELQVAAEDDNNKTHGPSMNGKDEDEDDNSNGDEDGDAQMGDIGGELATLAEGGNEVGTDQLLSKIDMAAVRDITRISKLPKKLKPLMTRVDGYMTKLISKKDEYDFLMEANDMSLEITNEQTMVHHFIKTHYKKRFPELESLAPSLIEYVQIIKALRNDIEVKDDILLPFVSKEKNLVIAMASIQAKETGEPLTNEELHQIIAACDLVLQFQEDKLKIEEYMSTRLAVFAPNLSAIVGARTAAQLIGVVGGLADLVAMPSCNVAALGNKRMVGIGFGHHGIRQQGFLFYSDLIQSVAPDLRKQAMRIAAGKLILAARVDHSGSAPDGSLGKKWKLEIESKIEKLEEAPENVATKALPIPEDKQGKKRGGRRYRKLKAKFEQSDLRKAQDRIEFGKQEQTIVDAFGEEIGLGMMSSRIATANTNKSKVSKTMKKRLENTNANTAGDFFNMELINLKPAPSSSDTKAIEGPMKKRLKR